MVLSLLPLHVQEVDPAGCEGVGVRLHQLEHIPLLLELVPPQAVGPAGSLGLKHLLVLPVQRAAAGDDLGKAFAAGVDLSEASAAVGALK